MKPSRRDAPRPAYLPVVLSLIAGLGHVLIGRSRRGFVMFVVTISAWNLALLSLLAPTDPLGTWTRQVGIAVGISMTAYAIFDVARLAVYSRMPSVRRHRRELLEQGILHYLRHDFPQARSYWDQMLDLDPADPVARLYLASLERRAGRIERALHHAEKALSANPKNRFYPEIEREIALSKEAHDES